MADAYGYFVAALRHKLGATKMSQVDLAKTIKTAPQTINAIVSGRARAGMSRQEEIARVYGCSLVDFLRTGEGIVSGKISENPSPQTEEAQPGTPSVKTPTGDTETTTEINVHHGVMMTTKVLSSKTGYANALWHNLKSFEAAVDRETEVGEMKEMMVKLAEDNRAMMEKMERMERAIITPEGDNKKRDEAANS